MQHHNLIHKHRSKTILDHVIQKQDYSWSCKTFSSSLSTWTLLTSILNPGLIICDRRERAQLLWVSHSYPFRIACLTFLDSMFPFSKLSLLSLDILHHKGGAFSLVIDPHTGLISNKNAFFTVIYILVWSVILITTMSLKFLYITICHHQKGGDC